MGFGSIGALDRNSINSARQLVNMFPVPEGQDVRNPERQYFPDGFIDKLFESDGSNLAVEAIFDNTATQTGRLKLSSNVENGQLIDPESGRGYDDIFLAVDFRDNGNERYDLGEEISSIHLSYKDGDFNHKITFDPERYEENGGWYSERYEYGSGDETVFELNEHQQQLITDIAEVALLRPFNNEVDALNQPEPSSNTLHNNNSFADGNGWIN